MRLRRGRVTPPDLHFSPVTHPSNARARGGRYLLNRQKSLISYRRASGLARERIAPPYHTPPFAPSVIRRVL